MTFRRGSSCVGLLRAAAVDRLSARHPAEVLADPRLGLLHVEVAGDRQHGVARDVVGVEEPLKLRRLGLAELVHVADRRPLVVRVAVRQAEEVHEQLAVRRVDCPLQILLVHDVPLGRELDLVDLEARHAVGLQPQRHLQRVVGHRVDVRRLVEAREGVGVAADAVDELHVPLAGHVLAAAEHHVLEHVRKALAVGRPRPCCRRGRARGCERRARSSSARRSRATRCRASPARSRSAGRRPACRRAFAAASAEGSARSRAASRRSSAWRLARRTPSARATRSPTCKLRPGRRGGGTGGGTWRKLQGRWRDAGGRRPCYATLPRPTHRQTAGSPVGFAPFVPRPGRVIIPPPTSPRRGAASPPTTDTHHASRQNQHHRGRQRRRHLRRLGRLQRARRHRPRRHPRGRRHAPGQGPRPLRGQPHRGLRRQDHRRDQLRGDRGQRRGDRHRRPAAQAGHEPRRPDRQKHRDRPRRRQAGRHALAQRP